MKKFTQLALYCVACLFVVALASCSGTYENTSKEKPNEMAASAEVLAEGQELYNQYCLKCHGVEGKGDGEQSISENLNAADLTTEKLHVVTHGLTVIISKPHYSDYAIETKMVKGGEVMPSLKNKLSTKQLHSLTAYVKKMIQTK